MNDSPLPDGASQRVRAVLFLTVVIDLLGFGIVLPLLPLYADTYVEAVVVGGRSSRWGGLILGTLMAVFSLMQFVFAPLWGRLSDRVGRRPILLLGLAGSVVFYTLFGFASMLPAASAGWALTLLFVARAGAGVAGATISTAQAVIADVTPPDERKRGMALIGAAFGIGFTIGPIVGFLSLAPGWGSRGNTGFAAAGLSLLALILAYRLLPETLRTQAAPRPRRWLDLGGYRGVLSHPVLAPVVQVFFLASLGFGGFEVTLALLFRDALNLSESASFLLFAYIGLVLLLTQGVVYRRVAAYGSEATFLLIGIVFMGSGVVLMGHVNGRSYQGTATESELLGMMLLALALAAAGFGVLTPSAQALISRLAPATQQGEVLGVNQSASALARILGPLLGLTLYKLTDSHSLPYVFGIGLIFLMVPLARRIRAETGST